MLDVCSAPTRMGRDVKWRKSLPASHIMDTVKALSGKMVIVTLECDEMFIQRLFGAVLASTQHCGTGSE